MRIKTTQLGEVNVNFHHERYDDLTYVSTVSGTRKNPVDTFTECVIEFGEDGMFVLGRAYLHPSDNFEKEQGRERSLKRAIEALELASNKTGREILAGYYSR